MVKEQLSRHEGKIINKLMQTVELNGVVCINDYALSMVKYKKNETKSKLIDNLLIGLKEYTSESSMDDKLVIERYKEECAVVNNFTDLGEKLKYKYYLRKANVKIVFVEGVNNFIGELQGKNKFESLRAKYSEYQNGKQSKVNISIMNKNEKIDFNKIDPSDILTRILKTYFYRGQSNMNHSIIPSVFRNGLTSFEDIMYYELLLKCPIDFKDCTRHIDVLSKMQHYGLATRMLDITTNPLVALYFAVSGNENIDGEFIVFNVEEKYIKNNYSDTIEVLSALSTQSDRAKKDLKSTALKYVQQDNINNCIDFSKREMLSEERIREFNKEKATKKLLHEIRMRLGDFEPVINPYDLFSPCFVQTIQNHNRIIRQDGMFIITGLPSNFDNDSQLLVDSIIKSVNKNRSADHDHKEVRYIIPAQFKKIMAIDLTMMGIHKKYLFPELESLSKTLNEEYKRV